MVNIIINDIGIKVMNTIKYKQKKIHKIHYYFYTNCYVN